MEMMKMKVNPLPSKTWHWVRMNDSELKIQMPDEGPETALSGQIKDLKWETGILPGKTDSENKADGSAGPDEAGCIRWQDVETGMGEEFAALMNNKEASVLTIPDGYEAAEPAVITLEASLGRAAGQILIHAGKSSSAAVVLVIRNGTADNHDVIPDCSDTVAVQLKFYAEDDARLNLYVAQILPRKGLSCLNIGGVCAGKTKVELIDVSLGSQNEYAGIAVKLLGDESSFGADMGYRVKTSQRMDINYVARHIGKESLSHMNAWGVLEDASFKLFRGTIDFAEGCPGSKGSEKEDVLLLGEHQVNQTIPLILCHEEDVEGDHGATISRLDDQILFYLGTRGVDGKTAENMIAKARIEALISRIPDEKIRREAESMIESSVKETTEGESDGEGERSDEVL